MMTFDVPTAMSSSRPPSASTVSVVGEMRTVPSTPVTCGSSLK
jgi:hypothetical protein